MAELNPCPDCGGKMEDVTEENFEPWIPITRKIYRCTKCENIFFGKEEEVVADGKVG